MFSRIIHELIKGNEEVVEKAKMEMAAELPSTSGKIVEP